MRARTSTGTRHCACEGGSYIHTQVFGGWISSRRPSSKGWTVIPNVCQSCTDPVMDGDRTRLPDYVLSPPCTEGLTSTPMQFGHKRWVRAMPIQPGAGTKQRHHVTQSKFQPIVQPSKHEEGLEERRSREDELIPQDRSSLPFRPIPNRRNCFIHTHLCILIIIALPSYAG